MLRHENDIILGADGLCWAGQSCPREPQVLPVFSSLLEITFFISLTTGSCFSSSREALSELSSTNWRGGARGKGTKPRRKMGESRSQRLSLIPSDLDGNIPLADHRNMTFGGSKKRGGTIRLVKSLQLVQRTRGHFPGCLTEVSFCGKNQRLE